MKSETQVNNFLEPSADRAPGSATRLMRRIGVGSLHGLGINR